MPSTLIGIASGAIKWDKSETDVSQDEIAFVNIKIVGYTAASQDLATAIMLVPATLPISSNGPVGNATQLSTAELQRRGARFDGDGTIRIDATYKCQVAAITTGPTGDENATEDKTGLRIATEEAPRLTHPVAMKFPRTELNLLSGLINGYIRTNWDIDQESGGGGSKEFVRQDPTTGKWDNEVTFSDTEYSVTLSGADITASPLDFARIIKTSQKTYKASTQMFTWTGVRRSSAPASELNKVGSISNPDRAPDVTDREWFYEGLMQDQQTNNIYSFIREYQLSGPGGALKQLYAGGTGDINANP